MNVHDELSDNEVLSAASEYLSGLPMASPPDVATIMARGRARRRRRLSAVAGLPAVAGSVVLGLGLSGALGLAPDGGTGTIRTAAFVLTRSANGTDTLTLTQNQALQPAALQQALTRDGIPALIKIGTDCTSNPAPPSPASLGAVSLQLPDGTPVSMPTTHEAAPLPADAEIIISPSKMPAGTELFVGFRSFGPVAVPVRLKAYRLLYTSSYACSHGFPAEGTEGS